MKVAGHQTILCADETWRVSPSDSSGRDFAGVSPRDVDVLRSLDLREDDFGIEPEITAKVCKRKLRIYELPIAYYGRSYAEGKKITWKDGFRAVGVLVATRFSR